MVVPDLSGWRKHLLPASLLTRRKQHGGSQSLGTFIAMRLFYFIFFNFNVSEHDSGTFWTPEEALGLRGVAVRRFSLVTCGKMGERRGQQAPGTVGACREGQLRGVASAVPVSKGLNTSRTLHPADTQPQLLGACGKGCLFRD